MKSTMMMLGLLATLFVAGGCARRTVVVTHPAPRVEVIPVAPSPRHVWVKGHYVQRGHRSVWVKGRYVTTRRRY